MNKKTYIWTIVVLIVINIGTLISLWTVNTNQESSQPVREEYFQNRTHHFLCRELNLNDNQQKQFHTFGKEHFLESGKIMKNIQKEKERLYKEISTNTTNDEKINEIGNKIGNLYKERELQNFYNFRRMNSICTPEQSKQLNFLIDEMLYKSKFMKRHGHKKNRRSQYKEEFKPINN